MTLLRAFSGELRARAKPFGGDMQGILENCNIAKQVYSLAVLARQRYALVLLILA